MRVGVIGGTGFLGARIVRELRSRGHSPVAIARRRPGDTDESGGEFRPADATVQGALDEALAGCEAAVWAAGSLRQSRGQTFHDVHVKGVRHLVAACRVARVRRLVLVSALGAQARAASAFHRAKAAGEDLATRSLLDTTILRPSAIFGPGDGFVRPLVAMLRRLPVALLPGRLAGRQGARMAPIAVTDVALAAAECLARPGTAGAVLDLPGPELLTIDEVYDRVLAAADLRRGKVGVPYLLIEPLALLLRRTPGSPFTFDHLAILEGQPPADPAPACRALDLVLQPFTIDALRPIVAG